LEGDVGLEYGWLLGKGGADEERQKHPRRFYRCRCLRCLSGVDSIKA
jgi:hypothetical protein